MRLNLPKFSDGFIQLAQSIGLVLFLVVSLAITTKIITNNQNRLNLQSRADVISDTPELNAIAAIKKWEKATGKKADPDIAKSIAKKAIKDTIQMNISVGHDTSFNQDGGSGIDPEKVNQEIDRALNTPMVQQTVNPDAPVTPETPVTTTCTFTSNLGVSFTINAGVSVSGGEAYNYGGQSVAIRVCDDGQLKQCDELTEEDKKQYPAIGDCTQPTFKPGSSDLAQSQNQAGCQSGGLLIPHGQPLLTETAGLQICQNGQLVPAPASLEILAAYFVDPAKNIPGEAILKLCLELSGANCSLNAKTFIIDLIAKLDSGLAESLKAARRANETAYERQRKAEAAAIDQLALAKPPPTIEEIKAAAQKKLQFCSKNCDDRETCSLDVNLNAQCVKGENRSRGAGAAALIGDYLKINQTIDENTLAMIMFFNSLNNPGFNQQFAAAAAGLCPGGCADGICAYNGLEQKFTCEPPDDRKLTAAYADNYAPEGSIGTTGYLRGACRQGWVPFKKTCNDPLLTCNEITDTCELSREASAMILADFSPVNNWLLTDPAVLALANSPLYGFDADLCADTDATYGKNGGCWWCVNPEAKTVRKLSNDSTCSTAAAIIAATPGSDCRANGGYCAPDNTPNITSIDGKCPDGWQCVINESNRPGVNQESNLFSGCAWGLILHDGVCRDQLKLIYDPTYKNGAAAQALKDSTQPTNILTSINNFIADSIFAPAVKAFSRSYYTSASLEAQIFLETRVNLAQDPANAPLIAGLYAGLDPNAKVLATIKGLDDLPPPVAQPQNLADQAVNAKDWWEKNLFYKPLAYASLFTGAWTEGFGAAIGQLTGAGGDQQAFLNYAASFQGADTGSLQGYLESYQNNLGQKAGTSALFGLEIAFTLGDVLPVGKISEVLVFPRVAQEAVSQTVNPIVRSIFRVPAETALAGLDSRMPLIKDMIENLTALADNLADNAVTKTAPFPDSTLAEPPPAAAVPEAAPLADVANAGIQKVKITGVIDPNFKVTYKPPKDLNIKTSLTEIGAAFKKFVGSINEHGAKQTDVTNIVDGLRRLLGLNNSPRKNLDSIMPDSTIVVERDLNGGPVRLVINGTEFKAGSFAEAELILSRQTGRQTAINPANGIPHFIEVTRGTEMLTININDELFTARTTAEAEAIILRQTGRQASVDPLSGSISLTQLIDAEGDEIMPLTALAAKRTEPAINSNLSVVWEAVKKPTAIFAGATGIFLTGERILDWLSDRWEDLTGLFTAEPQTDKAGGARLPLPSTAAETVTEDEPKLADTEANNDKIPVDSVALDGQLTDFSDSEPGFQAIYFQEVGQEFQIVSVNEDIILNGGSTTNLPLALATMAYLKTNNLGMDYLIGGQTTETLINKILIDHDEGSFWTLYNFINQQNEYQFLAQTFSSWGLDPFFIDLGDREITAGALGSILNGFANNSLGLTAAENQFILNALSSPNRKVDQTSWSLEKTLNLPPGATLIHIVGEPQNSRHDAGIVTLADGTQFVVVIMNQYEYSSDYYENPEAIGAIGNLLLIPDIETVSFQAPPPPSLIVYTPSDSPFVYYSQKDQRWQDIPTVGKATIENDGCGIMAGAMVTNTDPYTYWKMYSTHLKNAAITTDGTGFFNHKAVLESLGYRLVPIEGSPQEIKNQISQYTDNGIPVWINTDIKGDFGWIPHHTIAVDVDEDGSIIFNDPWYGENVSIPDDRIDRGTEDGDESWIVFAVIPPQEPINLNIGE
jgi:hypothetical protein